jgi:hypothetical protein
LEDGLLLYVGEQSAGGLGKLAELILSSQDDQRFRVLEDINQWLKESNVRIREGAKENVHGTEEAGPEGRGDVDDDSRVAGVDVLGSSKRDLAVERGDYEMPVSVNAINTDIPLKHRWLTLLSNPPQLAYEHPTLGRINVDKEISEYFALQKKFEEFRKCFLNMEKRIEKLEDKNTVYNSALEDFRRYTGRVESLEKMIGELYGKTSANAKAIQEAKIEEDKSDEYAEALDRQLEEIGHQVLGNQPEIHRIRLDPNNEVLLFLEFTRMLICLPSETTLITLDDCWDRIRWGRLQPKELYRQLFSTLLNWEDSRKNW